MKTLSDKAMWKDLNCNLTIYTEEDVKEFIKDLKEDASYEKEPKLNSLDDSLVWMGGMKSGWYQAMAFMRAKIDKRAGDKLT